MVQRLVYSDVVLKMKIPTKEDWQEAWLGLDEAYAFKNFYGKSLKEAMTLFEQCALNYQEDLTYMPEKPFKYYIRAYTYYLSSDRSREDSDGASCYISLIESALRDHPHWLYDSWSTVESLLLRIASEQDFFEASPEIYGSFERRVERVFKRYQKAQQYGAG